MALLLSAMLIARCTEPETATPSVAASQPAAPAAPPATAPASPGRAAPQATEQLDPGGEELPRDSWLRVEGLHEDVEGGWISGYNPTPNRIIITTENVAQFSMDVSCLQLDWSARVWVRINQNAFELLHKRNPVIHLRETSTGAWEIVNLNEE